MALTSDSLSGKKAGSDKVVNDGTKDSRTDDAKAAEDLKADQAARKVGGAAGPVSHDGDAAGSVDPMDPYRNEQGQLAPSQGNSSTDALADEAKRWASSDPTAKPPFDAAAGVVTAGGDKL